MEWYRNPDIIKQVYSELGVYDDKNVYIEHLNKVKNIFDIKQNVLEIGCGVIPAFANILAKEQLKLGK